MNKELLKLMSATNAFTQEGLPAYGNTLEVRPKIQDYKVRRTPPKEMREFKIKGKTILAHSRKDAIKRLKHGI